MEIYRSLSNSRVLRALVLLTVAVVLQMTFCPAPATAQDAAASPAQKSPDSSSSQPRPQPEANKYPATKPGTTLRLKVNLVPVPVVVRDSAGHAVGNLQKENFQLFDDRKQQQITQFTLEKSEAPGTDPTAIATAATAKHFVIPRTFTALLFDDVHSN